MRVDRELCPLLLEEVQRRLADHLAIAAGRGNLETNARCAQIDLGDMHAQGPRLVNGPISIGDAHERLGDLPPARADRSENDYGEGEGDERANEAHLLLGFGV
jgi:hypothetical protein